MTPCIEDAHTPGKPRISRLSYTRIMHDYIYIYTQPSEQVRRGVSQCITPLRRLFILFLSLALP